MLLLKTSTTIETQKELSVSLGSFLNGVEYTQVGGKAELSIFRDDDIV